VCSTILIDDSLATLVIELARLKRGESTMVSLLRNFERADAALAAVSRAFDERAPTLSAHAHHAYLSAILLARTIAAMIPDRPEMCERLSRQARTAQKLLRLLDRLATPADRALRLALIGELPSPSVS
jgi:hypothetical protein